MSAELLEDRLSEARTHLQALAARLAGGEGSPPAVVEFLDEGARSRVVAAAALLLMMLNEADLQALGLAVAEGSAPVPHGTPVDPEVLAAGLDTLASLATTMAAEARGGTVAR